MDYLPIFLKVRERPCLVVGAGKVAARKVALLLKAGARVTVVSPQCCADVETLTAGSDVTCIERNFQPADINGMVLAIAATDNDVAFLDYRGEVGRP